MLAVIEMLKYAVKEDYDNAKTEINLMPISFEYMRMNPANKANMSKASFKNLQKRMHKRKKNAKKGKFAN